MQVDQLIIYYTPKKVLPFAFFPNLPVLQKPGRNRSRFGKKSGAGAAKKFAGSPALLKTYYNLLKTYYQIVIKMK